MEDDRINPLVEKLEPELYRSISKRGVHSIPRGKKLGLNFQVELRAKVMEWGYGTLGDHGRQFDWGVLFPPELQIPPLLVECKCSELYRDSLLVYGSFLRELIGDGRELPASIAHVVLIKILDGTLVKGFYIIPRGSITSQTITLWKDVAKERESTRWVDPVTKKVVLGMDRDVQGREVNHFVVSKENRYRGSMGYIPKIRLFSSGGRWFRSWNHLSFALKVLIQFWENPQRPVGKDPIETMVSDIWIAIKRDRNLNPPIKKVWTPTYRSHHL